MRENSVDGGNTVVDDEKAIRRNVVSLMLLAMDGFGMDDPFQR